MNPMQFTAVRLNQKQRDSFFFSYYYRHTERRNRLDVANSAGNVKSVVLGGELDKSLLGAVSSDKSVNLDSLDLVKDLDSILDVSLGGLVVDSQDKGVGILNLLDGDLAVDVALDNLVSIESGSAGNRLSLVLRSSGKSKSLGSVEVDRGADLDDLGGVGTLNDSLLGVESLLLSSS